VTDQDFQGISKKFTANMASSSNPNVADPTPPKPSSASLTYSLSTLGIHADDPINASTDVAPALHVSTTFRYTSDPSKLVPVDDLDIPSREPGGPVAGDAHIYSRLTAPNTSRLELLLTEIIGQPVLTYASGLAAFHALLVYLHPRVVAIGGGYHGCHGVLQIYQKLTNCKIVDLHDEKTWDGEGYSLGQGDVVHLETPVNPHGTAFNIADFAERAHKRGAVLTIDATFAPPPLCDPFRWGADFVMHSGTKYFGGHSDMLCGVVAIGRESKGRPKGSESWQKDYWSMFLERLHLGGVMGSLEGWLGVRSLRTLELRVMRQSQNADQLVAWLDAGLNGTKGEAEVSAEEAAVIKKTVKSIQHASLQKEDMSWLKQQMPNGFGPVFSILLHSQEMARHFPSKLHLFHHATSLGGVESLIEWRRMSDQTVEPELLRLSIGVENWEDLKADILQGLRSIASMKE
jgi:cystathionine beta-lyase/cystathionine gamma-synthase